MKNNKTSPAIDLVIVIDTSVSMEDDAAGLSKAAEKAIESTRTSCPSDLRVAWLGVEGIWKNTKFDCTVRDYLTKQCYVSESDIKGRKWNVDDVFGGQQSQEDGAPTMEDIANHFNWRDGAQRAMFYLSDEPLKGGGKTVDQEDIDAANQAIETANKAGMVVHTYLAEKGDTFTPELIKEYARVAQQTKGHAFTAKDSFSGFMELLQKIICQTREVALKPKAAIEEQQVINVPQQSCENIPDGEAEQIKEIADLMGKLMDKRYPSPKKMLRGVHPKAHGCVIAVFEVNKDIAKDLQIGLFANPGKTYKTRIRFSNASSGLGPDTTVDPKSKSRKHSSRGMAVKILDVEGKVLLDDQGAQHQDFLMITEPAFAFANVADYLRLNQILLNHNEDPRPFFAPLQPGVTGFSEEEIERTKRTYGLITKIGSTPVANLLEVQYFSAAPFLFGPDRVMKVSVKPCAGEKPQEVPENPSEDYLRKALIETMSQDKDVCFDFMVQVRGKDEEDLNIENASTAWDEQQFPFTKVAKITIPSPQKDIDSPDAIKYGEKLCYSPWHSLLEYRPLGGINRLRKAVYLASQAHRASRVDK